MRAIGYAAVAFFLATPGLSAQTDWTQASRTEVTLSNFKFAPQSIRLQAGRPVVLHIVNTAAGGHNFAAQAFFGAAMVRPTDAAIIHGGIVEVAGHQTVDIELIPKAGRYPLKCTHSFHKMFGMSGEIVVG